MHKNKNTNTEDFEEEFDSRDRTRGAKNDKRLLRRQTAEQAKFINQMSTVEDIPSSEKKNKRG